MLYAQVQGNRIIKTLKGSKVEGDWKQARLLTIFLILFFFFFSLVRLLAQLDRQNDTSVLPDVLFKLGLGENHNMMMNASFVLTSLILVVLFRVDNKAYSALFELIKE